jgi:hypothetical protein
MVFTNWYTAHGEAAPAFLQCADIVPLSPADDSVDTNSVIIEGAGTITSFGESPHKVIKHVQFTPLVLRAQPGSPSITLVNSPHLNLLGKKNRAINDISFGNYFCNGDDVWTEIYFTQRGSATLTELEERIAALEAK